MRKRLREQVAEALRRGAAEPIRRPYFSAMNGYSKARRREGLLDGARADPPHQDCNG
jgi:hypothetical protein